MAQGHATSSLAWPLQGLNSSLRSLRNSKGSTCSKSKSLPNKQTTATLHYDMQARSTRIRIFLNPQLFLSGYDFHPHASGKSGIRSRNFFESALQSGNCWIRYESGMVWTLNPNIFFIRWRNKIDPSSLPWILYSRWQPRRLHCCQYSQRCPGYRDESGYVSVTCAQANSIWMRIRLDVEIFESGKEKVTDSKVSGYEWTGPQNRLCKRWAVEFPRVAH